MTIQAKQPADAEVFRAITHDSDSTHLLQQVGERYTNILESCRSLLRAAFLEFDGHEVDTQGDAFFVAFARASDAVAAAVTVQLALASHPWPEGVSVQVRIGLHTGEPQRSSEGYVGLDVQLFLSYRRRCAGLGLRIAWGRCPGKIPVTY